MVNILNTGQDNIRVKSGSYKGIALTFILLAAATNTAFSGALVDYTKANLKVILKRDGQTKVIANDNLRNLILTSGYFNHQAEYVLDNTKFTNTRSAGVGIYAQGLLPLSFDFGSVINVRSGDELYVEVKIGDGFYTAQLSGSELRFDLIEGVGLEYVTPIFRSEVIQASQTNPSQDVGDNVTRLILANFDKLSLLTADRVVTDLTLTSDKVEMSETNQDLQCRQESLFVSDAVSKLRYQNWCLYDSQKNSDNNSELDKVKVNLTTTSANVTAAQNFFLWKTFDIEPKTVQRAAIAAEKHQMKAVSKVNGELIRTRH